MKLKSAALSGASLLAFVFASAAVARAQSDAPPPADTIQTADEIVVQGTIGYRNRTESPEPTLTYGSSR